MINEYHTAIIILTYKRDDILEQQFNSIKEICNNTKKKVQIILIDNNQDHVNRTSFIPSDLENFQLIKPLKNLGVAGGRNLGFEYASAEYLLFLDDDALLQNKYIIDDIDDIFSEHDNVAIIAGRSYQPAEKRYVPEEIPHSQKSKNLETSWKTYRFIGVVHCIKSSMIQGFKYEDDFFYGMEEMDLSFYIIQRGFSILFHPLLYVHHHKHKAGRLIGEEYWLRTLRNKLIVIYKYYPLFNLMTAASIWILFSAIKTRRPIKVLNTLIGVHNDKKKYSRNRLNKKAIEYIKSTNGSLNT